MHNIRLDDLSLSTLRNIKKRIIFCRDNKDNNIADTFRGIDLNFFENCVDTLIEMKKMGIDVSKNAVYNDIVVQSISDAKMPIAKAENLVSSEYSIGENVELNCNSDSTLFRKTFKYIVIREGGIVGFSNVYIVTASGDVFYCSNIRADTIEFLDNTLLKLCYIGRLEIDLKFLPISDDYVPRKRNDIKRSSMDAIYDTVIDIPDEVNERVLYNTEYFCSKTNDYFHSIVSNISELHNRYQRSELC